MHAIDYNLGIICECLVIPWKQKNGGVKYCHVNYWWQQEDGYSKWSFISRGWPRMWPNIVWIREGFDYATRTSQRINMLVKQSWTNEEKNWPFIWVWTNFTPKQTKSHHYYQALWLL